MAGVPNIEMAGYLAASLCCIGSIGGLANQKTARIGNALGVMGVSTGVLTA
jgi:NAD(P) transhydrogenase